jgi:hypothetical protein
MTKHILQSKVVTASWDGLIKLWVCFAVPVEGSNADDDGFTGLSCGEQNSQRSAENVQQTLVSRCLQPIYLQVVPV